MTNYFNTLNFRNQLKQLKKSRLIPLTEFKHSKNYLKDKKIVIIGCGAQGLNQGLNMRDSGLNIAYALKNDSIQEKRLSWHNAVTNHFDIGTYEKLIPDADLVINLTPDKQHSNVVKNICSLMKKNSCLGYSHGFNIVELGENIRKDITVIMVAPKCPGTEVREEYKRGFGVPTLIAVHTENDMQNTGIEIAKSWAYAIGSHRAGVLESSFIAEVKSDLMGEQTILCGMLQVGSYLCFEKFLQLGYNASDAGQLIQYGWEIFTESLKHGGITLMMDRLSNSAKMRTFYLAEKLKIILRPLFKKHMDDIISGYFSSQLILDWKNHDKQLLSWRKKTKNFSFESAPISKKTFNERDYFEQGILMISFIKSGVELAFETMIQTGISRESAYYESLHELPLIANTIARKRLYEMNLVISDTAEYGNYLFFKNAIPLLKNFFTNLNHTDIDGSIIDDINNIELRDINLSIRNHSIECVGKKLRNYMKKMKEISLQE